MIVLWQVVLLLQVGFVCNMGSFFCVVFSICWCRFLSVFVLFCLVVIKKLVLSLFIWKFCRNILCWYLFRVLSCLVLEVLLGFFIKLILFELVKWCWVVSSLLLVVVICFLEVVWVVRQCFICLKFFCDLIFRVFIFWKLILNSLVQVFSIFVMVFFRFVLFVIVGIWVILVCVDCICLSSVRCFLVMIFKLLLCMVYWRYFMFFCVKVLCFLLKKLK